MQPTSGVFLALLGALTVGAAVVTVLTWDRPTLRRTRRIGAMLLTQALVVLVGLSAVNASQGFFTAWSDFGGGESHARLVVEKSSARGAQLGEAVKAARGKSDRRRGVIVSANLTGRRTGYTLPTRIYLPAAYFDTKQPDRRFPVVMFFNGYLGGVDTFQQRLGADTVLDDLISSQRIPPVVAVIPEKNPRRLADSECVDAVKGDKADTFLTQDVPEVVKDELRVSRSRAGWALMGYSTGGFCATNLALRHPEQFSAAVNLSGNYIPYVDKTTGELFGKDPKKQDENTPAKTIGAPRKCPVSFYLFSSKGDPEGARNMRKFAPLVKKPDALTVVSLPAGGHNFNVWRAALPDAFIWLSRVLAPYGSNSCPTAAVDPNANDA